MGNLLEARRSPSRYSRSLNEGETEIPEYGYPAPEAPVKVLYILGAPRCGSTVLDNILNEVDGFFSAGELRFLWSRMHQGRLCGCGRSFSECEVWGSVIARMMGSTASGALQVAVERQRSIAGTWRTWQLLHQISSGNLSDEVRQHAGLTGRLYAAISEQTGARVVVDSSKRPWDGALLGVIEDVSPYFIHLVRDPRAMAFSQSRVKTNPDRNQPGVMAPTSVARSASQWIRRNLAADAVRRAHPESRSLLIGYHDFCLRPSETVRAITTLVGEAGLRLPFADDHTVNLGGNHTVSGNPDRFRTGLVPIREDNKWTKQMSNLDKLVVSALTLPLSRRYSGAFG